MKTNPGKFIGIVGKGKLILDDPAGFSVHMARMEGVKVVVEVRKFRKERSLSQNDYLWGVVYEILSDNGNDPLWWHKYCKIRFLLGEIIGRPPDTDRIIDSGSFEKIAGMLTTTSLDTAQMEKYLSEIRKWASAERGIYIPSPNELPINLMQ